MRYQGSKYKMRNVLKTIIEKNVSDCTTYVEPFMGGCNSLAYISHPYKIGNDYNENMVDLWKSIKNGCFSDNKQEWLSKITKEMYNDIKNNPEKYSDWVKGYVSACCSYGGGIWNGYANYNPKKNEDHIGEAYRGLMKQISEFVNMKGTTFHNMSYDKLPIEKHSFIYCDPPYESTKKYVTDFDNKAFWAWCRLQVRRGCKVLVSEFSAPNDFIEIWSQDMQDGMRKNNGKKVEKLFIHKSQIDMFNL